MTSPSAPVALLVEGYAGQRSVAEISRLVEAGEMPRLRYVEIARAMGADVIDDAYMRTQATPVGRLVARGLGIPWGQVVEAFLRRRRYRVTCVWSDRLGLPLALLLKLARSRRRVVLISVWLSRPKKALFFTRLGVGSHLGAIVNSSTYQIDYARQHLGMPVEKLRVVPKPVDERFWAAAPPSAENRICAVGWEARDFVTLLAAVEGLDVHLTVAVGMIEMVVGSAGGSTARDQAVGDDHQRLSVLAPWKRTYGYTMQEAWLREMQEDGPPANVTIVYQLSAPELRELYRRSRFVVVPLHDVDTNCGVTTVTEAMAMCRAVVVTRTRGQNDVITDGEEGVYVAPGSVMAMRSAIAGLLADPATAERMGRAGRDLVERDHTMDAFVGRLRAVLDAGPEAS
ncbi:MAG: hypothetical protein V7605_399 [Acidimicrobiaceae bacterium]